MLNCSSGAKHDMVLKQSEQFLPFISIFLLKVQSLFFLRYFVYFCLYVFYCAMFDGLLFFKKENPIKGTLLPANVVCFNLGNFSFSKGLSVGLYFQIVHVLSLD